MMIYRNFAVKLITVLAIALSTFWANSSAIALSQDFQLKSDRGYRVETSFDYQSSKNSNSVDFLQVRFYNPEGGMIASYDNVVHGVVQGEYFEFNFAPQTQQLLGNIDLGGEAAGEIYLKGNVESGFALIEVKPSGEEITVDSGRWTAVRGDS